MLSTRDPPQNKRPTQTEDQRFGKNYFKQMDRTKSQGSNTHMRQNRLQNKGQKERHRRTLHNTQRKNTSRKHKHCKHICTQHMGTQIYKGNLGGLQERYRQQHTYSRGF